MTIKILFLAANPKDCDFLQSKREYTKIAGALQPIPHRQNIELIPSWDLRPQDLSSLLVEHHPQIVHFSGHGQEEGIILINDRGEAQITALNLLADLLGHFGDCLRIVILNGCDTDALARQLAETIDCAIGINGSINDDAAVLYANSLYKLLAFGYSIQKAHDISIIDLRLAGMVDENNFPRLYGKKGVNLDNVYLIGKSYRGHWLLTHPEVWNEYVNILDFAKTIHHIFQTLDNQHLNEFINWMAEFENARGHIIVRQIASFHIAWDNYCNFFNILYRELNERFAEEDYIKIKTSFLELKKVEDSAIREIIEQMRTTFFDIITERLHEFCDVHKKACTMLTANNVPEVIHNPTTLMQLSNYCFQLLGVARTLTVDSDNFLRKLIENLMGRRE